MINNESRTLILNKGEKKLLDDLILFSKRCEEVFFNDENDLEVLTIIDNIIESKLRGLEPFTIYKLLNNLYRNNIYYEEVSPEVKILNDIECDLAKERLGITLLSHAIDKDFGRLYSEGYLTGFQNSWYSNMLNFFLNNYEELNYFYMLDHIESFICLINDNGLISTDIKYDVLNKLLFIYKDIELDLGGMNINKEAGKILSNRYDAFSLKCFGGIVPITRDEISIPIFCDEVTAMLEIRDDQVVDPSCLMIGKIYLDNILSYVSDEGFKNICRAYNDIEGSANLTNHYLAFEYIHNSILERTKNKDKVKKYELNVEVIS